MFIGAIHIAVANILNLTSGTSRAPSPTVLNDCQFAYRRKIRSDFVVVGDGALDVP